MPVMDADELQPSGPEWSRVVFATVWNPPAGLLTQVGSAEHIIIHQLLPSGATYVLLLAQWVWHQVCCCLSSSGFAAAGQGAVTGLQSGRHALV